jgi:hypothetical protein
MKKTTFFLLLLVFSVSVFGQEPSMAKTDYLQKAKSQNTIAWVLLSSGLAASRGNHDDLQYPSFHCVFAE